MHARRAYLVLAKCCAMQRQVYVRICQECLKRLPSTMHTKVVALKTFHPPQTLSG